MSDGDSFRPGHDPPPLNWEDAESHSPPIAYELEREKRLACDLSLPLERRIGAFEDIVDSEVGDTTMSRARNVERQVELRQIYLKFEGGNPTGTQKDRIAFAHAMDALRRGFDAITIATCGNYGVATALACSLCGLKCVICIPEGYHTKRIKEMQQYPVEIVRVPGDYEAAVEFSRRRAQADDIYDANPGGSNVSIQLKAYGEIAYEIYDDLRDAPSAVAVPVSNGTSLLGIYRGFLSLYRRGRTSRMPHMVAGSSHNKNPIVAAFQRGDSQCRDLAPERIRETEVNEPLINWHSIDGQEALDAILATGGWAEHGSDRSMKSYSRLLREQEGLMVLPASTAGLIALLKGHAKRPLPADRYVVILTGRKS